MRIFSVIAVIGMACFFMMWSMYEDYRKRVTKEDFSSGLLHWVAESENDSAQFIHHNDTLEIISPKGLTLWYDLKLKGNYQISYDISVRMEGQQYDRLSDLNCFWAAVDPLHPDNLFTRSAERGGRFANYDLLNLFYVGYGGNKNTTTRFRKYTGIEDDKPVIKEFLDEAHLLKPNEWYHITITVKDGLSQYAVNGETLFEMQDNPLATEGYFGLRLLKNRVLFTGFTIKKENG